MAAAQHPSDKTAGDRARRRISRRLLPFLFVLYMIAYVDRSNIAFAALQMKAELGFSAETIGFGAGVFFCGYFLLARSSTSNRQDLEACSFTGVLGVLAALRESLLRVH